MKASMLFSSSMKSTPCSANGAKSRTVIAENRIYFSEEFRERSKVEFHCQHTYWKGGGNLGSPGGGKNVESSSSDFLIKPTDRSLAK
jgi:hypothetical protein